MGYTIHGTICRGWPDTSADVSDVQTTLGNILRANSFLLKPGSPYCDGLLLAHTRRYQKRRWKNMGASYAFSILHLSRREKDPEGFSQPFPFRLQCRRSYHNKSGRDVGLDSILGPKWIEGCIFGNAKPRCLYKMPNNGFLPKIIYHIAGKASQSCFTWTTTSIAVDASASLVCLWLIWFRNKLQGGQGFLQELRHERELTLKARNGNWTYGFSCDCVIRRLKVASGTEAIWDCENIPCGLCKNLS